MAFQVYAYSTVEEIRSYRHLGRLSLLGEKGILATYLKQYSEKDTPFKWSLSGEQLATLAMPVPKGERLEVVIDLLPEGLVDVNLSRLSRINGVSEDDSSDLILCCEPLYQGKVKHPVIDFKKCFKVAETQSSRQLLEAIHMNGGTEKGNYSWGPPKMNIGAAISPGNPNQQLKMKVG